MEKSDEAKKQNETNITYYTTPYYNSKIYPNYRDLERMNGYMYYPTNEGSSMPPMKNTGNNGMYDGMDYYTEMPNIMGRDPREGRSPMRRRMYMEGKEMHNDPTSQLHELEAYLQELSTDITEMVKDASP